MTSPAGSRPMPGRTITVHLTRRDPDFLHKLTMSCAFVVPAGSPRRATTGRTPPGTGPYRVAAWDSIAAELFRNRYFGSGPSRSRPRLPGPDRGRRPQRGHRGPDRRGPARSRRPGRPREPVHQLRQGGSAESAAGALPGGGLQRSGPDLDWMFLTCAAPVRRSRVRKAVNLAIDRAHVVALTGGPESGTPACQIVPIGFPATSRTAPTPRTRRGAAWTAPDMDRARRLVAASGRSGERVVVWSLTIWQHRPVFHGAAQRARLPRHAARDFG